MNYQVLIVDDSAIVRAELHHVLDLTEEITVVGEAEDGWDAIQEVESLNPEFILMDLKMPGMDGFEATHKIKAQYPDKKVIIYSVYGDVESKQKAFQAGADLFIVKGTDLRTLLGYMEQTSNQNAGP